MLIPRRGLRLSAPSLCWRSEHFLIMESSFSCPLINLNNSNRFQNFFSPFQNQSHGSMLQQRLSASRPQSQETSSDRSSVLIGDNVLQLQPAAPPSRPPPPCRLLRRVALSAPRFETECSSSVLSFKILKSCHKVLLWLLQARKASSCGQRWPTERSHASLREAEPSSTFCRLFEQTVKEEEKFFFFSAD